jgi:COPII coat assembly protein SEC16
VSLISLLHEPCRKAFSTEPLSVADLDRGRAMATSEHRADFASLPGDDLQTGHWLPALRPDTSESLDEISGPRTQIGVIPPTPVSRHDDNMNTYTTSNFGALLEENEEDGTPEPDSHKMQTGSAWSSQPVDRTSGGVGLPSDDDDERLDPAWGIKRTDTTHILDSVHRSTTFPDLSPPEVPHSQTKIAKPAPELEVKDINGTLEVERVVEQEKQSIEPQNLNWTHGEETAAREASAWTVPASGEPVDSADLRYEEGLPLIQAEENTATVDLPATEAPAHDPFDAITEEEEETSFFTNVNGASPEVPEHPTLDRKSTAQVLRSLNLPDKDLPDSPAATDTPAETSFFDNLATSQAPVDAETYKRAEEQDVDAMWAAALEDNEFLVEDADDLLPDSDDELPMPTRTQSMRAAEPQHTLQRQGSGNPYAPHQPSTSEMFQMSPTRSTHNNVGLTRPELPPMGSFQAQLPQRPAPQNVKSFVDQAKDGYKSPYDLPLDLKPKRRSHVPQPVQTTRAVAPPPRSSSLSEKPLQSPFASAGPPTTSSVGGLQPAESSPGIPPRSVSALAPSKSRTPNSGSSSGFFEELPITSKPRPSGRSYTPQNTTPVGIPPPPTQALPLQPSQVPVQQVQHQTTAAPSDPYSQYQLQAPTRLDPYATEPLQPHAAVPAALTNRYSPAPPASVTSSLGPRPGPSPRYSPAPPPQATDASRYSVQQTAQATPPMQAPSQAAPILLSRKPSQTPPAVAAAILPFQPRTSSPLAYNRGSVDESVNGIPPQPPGPPGPRNQYTPSTPSVASSVASPRGGRYGDLNGQLSPPKRPDGQPLPPPRRSQTQSPSKQRPQAVFPTSNGDIINRPATAYGQALPNVAVVPLSTVQPARPAIQARGAIPDLDFIRPQDDTQLDPLERWKGAPVFKFGFGGSVASTFPKQVPRYTTGVARPQIKAAPGEVTVRDCKDLLPQDQLVRDFPGPLRSKSKKKDTLSWMANYINGMEAGMPNIFAAQAHDDPARRLHEKVLLWKIVRVLVEHDGSLEGAALKAINLILSPEVFNVDESSPIQYRAGEQSSGIYRPSGANVRPDSIDPMAVEALRKRLLSGDRQGAVYHAMDNRLWSHALVLASTMERSMWGSVVREFVRQEVKTAGENTESLSALYEILGGNFEESIDELVPPSARAGLQMINRADPAASNKNALEGLNKWKETLSLVLNNRCPGDHQALAVLGKLLEDYDRIEAAHICYMFSKAAQKSPLLGGTDEEQASIVLLGANHKARPADFGRDQDAIMLTEIYEFATGVLGPGAPLSFMPHLGIFKLQRAMTMSEAGMKAEAQAYCDAIAATFGKSSKMSLYYHPLFISELDDLSNKLKQTPIQGSSWIGKPSLEKVGGSMWTKFSSFVAGGDDSDAESKGSGKDAVEAGPFARIAGTPSVSRTGSQSDLFGSYPPVAPTTAAGSKYAPNGLQSTRSSAELTRGRPSLDSQRSPPATSQPPNIHQYGPVNMFQPGHRVQSSNPYEAFAAHSPQTSFPQSPPTSSYMPNNVSTVPASSTSPMRPAYVPTPPSEDVIHQAYGHTTNSISNIPEEQPYSFGDYQPVQPEYAPPPSEHLGDEMVGQESAAQSYSYEPPTGEYVPYVPEPDSPEESSKATKPKKKSFLADDDDEYAGMNNARSSSQARPSDEGDDAARKRANDAAADAAFRAAAEADAAREKEQKQSKRSSSWLGGWFGGKKEDGLDAASSNKGGEQKVFRAKLGESKMKLYYDKDLGKWVNPDNPDAVQKSATPPPPRTGGTPAPPMGPPRAPIRPGTSSSNPSYPGLGIGPASGPPSRAGTPADGPGPSLASSQIGVVGPPSAASTPPIGPPSTPGLAPPPRPSTAMSNASSIDDLIGPATGRKTTKATKKGAKRYVDVMAK